MELGGGASQSALAAVHRLGARNASEVSNGDRRELTPSAFIGEKPKVLGPMIAADVGIVLGHALARVTEDADQIFKTAAIQTPVAREAVPQAVEADDMGPATPCRSFKPGSVQHLVQRLAEYAGALVSGSPCSVHEDELEFRSRAPPLPGREDGQQRVYDRYKPA